MRSEPESPRGWAVVELWKKRAAELKQWECNNRDIADAWNEAIDEDESRRREREERKWLEHRAKTAPDYLLKCGVGELDVDRFRLGIFDNQARDGVRKFIASDKFILLLHGGPGSGKTLCSAEALLSVRDGSGTEARFITADMFARMSYFDLDRYGALCAPKMLVLDDIGEEQSSSTFMAGLDGLLNERLRHKRRTIITTNLSIEKFRDRFARPGSRIASRLAGYGMVFGSGETDHRREK